jgi:hypothetical protein
MKKHLLLLPLLGLMISCNNKLTNDDLRESDENLSGYWSGYGESLKISLPYDNEGNCWFVYESSSDLVLEGSVNIKSIPYKSNQWGEERKHLNLIIENTSNPRVSRERFKNWIYINYRAVNGMLRSNEMRIGDGFSKYSSINSSDFKPDNFKKKFWKL